MTRITPIVLLVLVLLGTAIVAAGQTLQNGGFEAQTTAPWQASRWDGDANVELDRKQVHSGACSIRLRAREDASTAVVTQTVKRLPDNGGNVAFLAGWWRGEGLSGTGGRIVVRMLGPDGRRLCDVAPVTANGTFDWKPFAQAIQLPKDTAEIQVFLELWSSAATRSKPEEMKGKACSVGDAQSAGGHQGEFARRRPLAHERKKQKKQDTQLETRHSVVGRVLEPVLTAHGVCAGVVETGPGGLTGETLIRRKPRRCPQHALKCARSTYRSLRSEREAAGARSGPTAVQRAPGKVTARVSKPVY